MKQTFKVMVREICPHYTRAETAEEAAKIIEKYCERNGSSHIDILSVEPIISSEDQNGKQ